MLRSLVGSEMCIRDRFSTSQFRAYVSSNAANHSGNKIKANQSMLFSLIAAELESPPFEFDRPLSSVSSSLFFFLMAISHLKFLASSGSPRNQIHMCQTPCLVLEKNNNTKLIGRIKPYTLMRGRKKIFFVHCSHGRLCGTLNYRRISRKKWCVVEAWPPPPRW